jgi:cytochrome o ubiquinol oxidase subunit 3
MTEHVLKKHESDHDHDVSGNTLFGFWVYLMTDFILFATLFAAYAVLRYSEHGKAAAAGLFSLPFALSETLILLVSSFTCGLGLLAARRGKKKQMVCGFALTFLLGMTFFIMVGSELANLVKAGSHWQNSAFLSSYFTLAGTHALHILFGLLFMVLFTVQALYWGFTEAVLRRLICMSLFWFFSYVVWIFMFTIVYLLGTS